MEDNIRDIFKFLSFNLGEFFSDYIGESGTPNEEDWQTCIGFPGIEYCFYLPLYIPTSHPQLLPLSRTYPMSDLWAFHSLPQTSQVERNLPMTLTLSISLLGHHIATDTEIQPLQSWLQPHIGSVPQSMVHGKGPHHDSDN